MSLSESNNMRFRMNKRAKALNIAYIVSAFPVISETFILNQVLGMINRGHRVRIYPQSPPLDEKMHDEFSEYILGAYTEHPIPVPASKFRRRVKLVGLFLRRLFRRPILTVKIAAKLLIQEKHISYPRFFLALSLLKYRYDIIHCHFGCNALPLLPILQAGLPGRLITSFHGHDANSFIRANGPAIYDSLFARGDLFTANTDFTKQQIVHAGCDADKIRILPVGLQSKKFLFPERRYDHLPPWIILSIGRLVEKKGFEYSIRAFAKLYSLYPAEYHIVGEGPLREQLEGLVQTLNLRGRVIFHGARTQREIVSFYHRADLFVLPSVTAANGDKEGQALVLQEAQTAGVPVIATLHNGIPDGVRDGVSGFLVPERDIDALAERMELLLKDSGLRERMGKNGVAFAAGKYDVDVLNDSLERIYYDVAGRRKLT